MGIPFFNNVDSGKTALAVHLIKRNVTSDIIYERRTEKGPHRFRDSGARRSKLRIGAYRDD